MELTVVNSQNLWKIMWHEQNKKPISLKTGFYGPGMLYFTDCVSLCLSKEKLKAVGPFYLVS